MTLLVMKETKAKRFKTGERSADTRIPDKNEFIRTVLTTPHIENFKKSFDMWWLKVAEYTEATGDCGCLTFKKGNLPKSKKLYLTKCQVKVPQWLKGYLPEVTVVPEDLKISLGQFLLIGKKSDHLISRLRIGTDTEEFLTTGSRTGYEASHLCHNNSCFNPDHIVADPYWVNRHSREGCPGPAGCICWKLDKRVQPSEKECKCLVPSPNYAKWNKDT